MEIESFWYSAVVLNMGPSDAPAAVVMGAGFFASGLTMVLRPGNVRESFDRFADSWRHDSWHPYKVPLWGLRVTGLIGIAGAILFFYIAYVGLHR